MEIFALLPNASPNLPPSIYLLYSWISISYHSVIQEKFVECLLITMLLVLFHVLGIQLLSKQSTFLNESYTPMEQADNKLHNKIYNQLSATGNTIK